MDDTPALEPSLPSEDNLGDEERGLVQYQTPAVPLSTHLRAGSASPKHTEEKELRTRPNSMASSSAAAGAGNCI